MKTKRLTSALKKLEEMRQQVEKLKVEKNKTSGEVVKLQEDKRKLLTVTKSQHLKAKENEELVVDITSKNNQLENENKTLQKLLTEKRVETNSSSSKTAKLHIIKHPN